MRWFVIILFNWTIACWCFRLCDALLTAWYWYIQKFDKLDSYTHIYDIIIWLIRLWITKLLLNTIKLCAWHKTIMENKNVTCMILNGKSWKKENIYTAMLDVVIIENWFWVLIVSISNELDGTSYRFTEHLAETNVCWHTVIEKRNCSFKDSMLWSEKKMPNCSVFEFIAHKIFLFILTLN